MVKKAIFRTHVTERDEKDRGGGEEDCCPHGLALQVGVGADDEEDGEGDEDG